MPFIAKEQEGVTSRIAIRNNSNCNKIKGRILIKDETGAPIAHIPVGWLSPKHISLKDFNATGDSIIPPGFVGAAEFQVGSWVGWRVEFRGRCRAALRYQSRWPG
jgi:hypothetical protein